MNCEPIPFLRLSFLYALLQKKVSITSLFKFQIIIINFSLPQSEMPIKNFRTQFLKALKTKDFGAKAEQLKCLNSRNLRFL